MNTKYIKDHYQFQPLTVEHVLTDFECSSKDLTEFLRNDALTQQELYLNSTNLIMCKDKIIGFVSLLTDTFKIGNIQDEKLKKIIKKELNLIGNKNIVPAVKIGRLPLIKNMPEKDWETTYSKMY